MAELDVEDPKVGDTIDRRYLLKREIARGGMGAVFEANHLITGRSVALKMLYGEGRTNREARDRLLIEARSLAAARHPNIVEVLDAGTTERDDPYLVLEKLEGRSLDGILAARHRLTISDVAHVGRQLCDALGFMHARGVIHRDIKPSNVFVARDALGQETVKLFDFGIASVGDELRGKAKRITIAGALYGTAEYMSPEQLMAKDPIDHRCDLYALGVLLYECLAGELPFSGTFPEIILQVMQSTAPPVVSHVRTDMGPSLTAVVTKLLSRDPDNRYVDAMRVGRALIEATGLSVGRSALLGEFDHVPGVRGEPSVNPTTAAPNAQVDFARRRQFARAPYVTPMKLRFQDGTIVEARSEDVSEGGMLVVLEHQCAPGDLIDARLAIPTTGEIVLTKAVARWIRPARGRNALGLEWIELPLRARETIAAYVAHVRAKSERAETEPPSSKSGRVERFVQPTDILQMIKANGE